MPSMEMTGLAATLSPGSPSGHDEAESVPIEPEAWLRDRPVVLVVDDDEDVRETVAVLLEARGISVIRVANGEAALLAVACFPVAALVLDVLLPDRTGFDVCRALRGNPATEDIPVIMLTALTGVADEVSAALAGADAFLVKPASGETLLRHLTDLL